MQVAKNASPHILKSPLTKNVSEIPPKVISAITSSRNKNANSVPREKKQDDKTKNAIDFCRKQSTKKNDTTSLDFNEARTSLNVSEIYDIDIELNEDGIAYASENNLIKLTELVRENPCLWNHTLPVEQRNQYAVSTAWLKVAGKFPGKY